ncbi:MAG: FkbM family methyltransferase [Pirellulaceae bacterium]|jgi:predicted O-methyltransferase YrrM|nr:FkbM family methyltransferase [Pirellulaceae bacterium]
MADIATKSAPEDMAGRIRELNEDPSNQWIPRVDRAGEIVDGYLVTHNGLLVTPSDPGYVQLLTSNTGCHEPQEEYLFQQVLEQIPGGGQMLELGAYWAFYSMWFAKEVQNANCYLVEPRKKNLKVGKHNFAKNGFRGEFFRSKIGHGHLGVDRFLDAQQLEYIDLLHADIQGAEYEMLCDAEQSLRNGRIGFVFVGTHSQELHYACKAYLEKHDYVTIAHADFDHGTYCCDGVLVAQRAGLSNGLAPLEIPLRDAAGQKNAEQQLRHLRIDKASSSKESGLLRKLLDRLQHRAFSFNRSSSQTTSLD